MDRHLSPLAIDRCLILSLLAMIAGMPLAASGAITFTNTDLFDASQGAVVTANSGTLGSTPIGELFDGVRDPAIFSDGLPTGTVHWVEWQTPVSITLRSIRLWAEHDQAPRDATARGFSRFSLYGYNTVTSAFDILIYEVFPSSPYTSTTPPPATTIDPAPLPGRDEFLLLAANVIPTTNDRFRAEFVQFGFYASNASGPRVNELDGYDTFTDLAPSIPEPSRASLLALGSLAAIWRRRRSAGPSRQTR